MDSIQTMIVRVHQPGWHTAASLGHLHPKHWPAALKILQAEVVPCHYTYIIPKVFTQVHSSWLMSALLSQSQVSNPAAPSIHNQRCAALSALEVSHSCTKISTSRSWPLYSKCHSLAAFARSQVLQHGLLHLGITLHQWHVCQWLPVMLSGGSMHSR